VIQLQRNSASLVMCSYTITQLYNYIVIVITL